MTDFVVIGRNVESTLRDCLDSIFELKEVVSIGRIIYVDSASSDNSVSIANCYSDVRVICVSAPLLSAAVGRYIGGCNTISENIVFVDGDMQLLKKGISRALSLVDDYKMVITERHEVILDQFGNMINEIPSFYQIKDLSYVRKIGGFLIIKRDLIEEFEYNTLVVDEEESDLIARIYSRYKILPIAINDSGYRHLNFKTTQDKIRLYTRLWNKTGYLVSFINAVRNKYLVGYFVIQKKYLLIIAFYTLLFSLLLVNHKLFLVAYLIGLVSYAFVAKGLFLTFLFFPYKLLFAVLLSLRRNRVEVTFK